MFDVEILPSDYLATTSDAKIKIDKLESDWKAWPSSSEKKTVFQVSSFSGTIQMLTKNIHTTIGGSLVMIDSISTSTLNSFMLYGMWLGRSDVIIKGRIAELSPGSFAIELIAKNDIPLISLSELLLNAV